MRRARQPGLPVFVSYSHRDEDLKDRLLEELGKLDPTQVIELWNDRQIGAGEEWFEQIRAAMDRAAIAVCLVSSAFLKSEFVRWHEVPYLMERRYREGLTILPVLLDRCEWQEVHWLKALQLLPRDGKSVREHFAGREQEVFEAVALRALEVARDPRRRPPAARVPGWDAPEAVDVDRLPMTGMELFGRDAQLALLDLAWRSAETRVVCFVGWGGLGKSTLVRKWLDRMAEDNYRGARRVFAWSFFSRGEAGKAGSADLFFATALAWFGDQRPNEGSPWDKVERLVTLIRRQKTLFVLDGLEALQSDTDFDRGRLRDPAMAALLTELALDNAGLCVITTRETVADLVPHPATVAMEDLGHLSTEAARALLRIGGVHGSDAELEAGARRFGNHALALDLLVGFLQGVPGMRIADSAVIELLDMPEKSGRHARSLMQALAKRFGPGPETGLLKLLGLFYRPARADEIAALRAVPVVPGLSEDLLGVSDVEWLRLVSRLRRMRLLDPEDPHDVETIDAHPLIREHFAAWLRAQSPDAWRDGNLRLFYYLQQRCTRLPATLAEMAPLLEAVVYGCNAGRHQEALDLHYVRVQRGGTVNYVESALGAFGTNLAVLSYLFEKPWTKPVEGLSRPAAVALLGWVGFGLRALGRNAEAEEAMKACLQGRLQQHDFSRAALEASNLSQFYVQTGALSPAVDYGQKAVALADRGSDRFWQMGSRCMLADALHQQGRRDDAAALFLEAEEIQRGVEHASPRLYSLQGYLFCDLLLDESRDAEVWERAEEIGRAAKHRRLDVGLGHLACARVAALALQRGQRSDSAAVEAIVNAALSALGDAGATDWLVPALICRAAIHRLSGQSDAAERDLRHALNIAQRLGLKPWLADCHLEAARLHLQAGEREPAKAACQRARSLIDDIGYGRRVVELGALQDSLAR